MIVSYNVIEGHNMREDFCVYWQFIPLMGLLFSTFLLLNVALDRLLSTRMFYKSFIVSQSRLYLSTHMVSAFAFSLVITLWTVITRSSEE
ncbi:hypothetical protein GCK32_002548 [Trichostrongylus colubriformis]|uniref:Uncharacterized protein n=1 Tax=Trichostrongylus colubriformis TaxID=6319 RepID=A0AAN8FHC2_TRICO